MKKNFKKFLKLNTKYNFSSFPKKILIVDRERDFQSIFNSIFAIALGAVSKKNSIILSRKKELKSVKIFQSFGFTNYIFPKEFLIGPYSVIVLLKTIYLTLITIFKIKLYGFEFFIRKFTINNIPFGDLIYDYYKRFDKKFLNLRIDFKFIKILFKSIFKIYLCFNIIKKNEINFMIVSTAVYATYSGIMSRIGIYQKIKVIEPHLTKDLLGLSYLVYNPKKKLYFTSDSVTYSNLKKNFYKVTKNLAIKDLDNFLDNRYSGKIKTTYTTPHDIKNLKKYNIKLTKKKLLKKFGFDENQIKKIVVISPHAFSDTTYNDGRIHFIDYYHHFLETIKYVSSINSKKILWLVRSHPSSSMYGENGIVEKITERYSNKYIKVCPKISSKDLIKICDHAVTCTGRISLEFAAAGKRSIMGGINDLSSFNLFKTSSNKKNYFLTLKNILKINKLNDHKKNQAKKLLFFLETLKPNIVLPESEIIDKKVLKKYQKKFDFISTTLLNNLKKKNFYNDRFFKTLVNKIKDDKDFFKY